MIKPPGFEGLSQLPAFLADSKQSSGVQTAEGRVKKLSATLRTRIGRVLKEPSKHDPVYKVAQRLFRQKTPLNLSRDAKVRFEIRRLARKRFLLGYPPRKDSDLSIGDAINWEWIVRCAQTSGNDVVIVSRDQDYGVRFADRPIINDWLLQEFKERVSRRRRLVLTDRLAEGLKQAGVKVSRSEEKNEEQFLEEKQSHQSSDSSGNMEGRSRDTLFVQTDLGLRLNPQIAERYRELQRQLSNPELLEKFRAIQSAMPSREVIEKLNQRLSSPEMKEILRRLETGSISGLSTATRPSGMDPDDDRTK